MIKFPSLRSEILPRANGQEATDELALRRAERERQAQLTDKERRKKLAQAASSGMGVLPARLSEYTPPTKVQVPHDETFHIPDAEPKVSKAGTAIEEKAVA